MPGRRTPPLAPWHTRDVGRRADDLRHSFASSVLDQTNDMKATQHLLGHGSDKTTARYAKRVIPGWLLAAVAKVRSLRHGNVPHSGA